MPASCCSNLTIRALLTLGLAVGYSAVTKPCAGGRRHLRLGCFRRVQIGVNALSQRNILIRQVLEQARPLTLGDTPAVLIHYRDKQL